MRTPGKPLTPAELSTLEHAFASDPASDAYRPLTEAYLAAGRFMEAMVVCKKGVEGAPGRSVRQGASSRRVYAEQGKDWKALEELAAVLARLPGLRRREPHGGRAAHAPRRAGAGQAALRRAAEAAPDDPEVREALAKYGLTRRRAGRRAPPPGRPPPPAEPPAGRARRRRAAAHARRPASRPPPAGAGRVRAGADAPRPSPARAQEMAYAEQLAQKYATAELPAPRRQARRRRRRRGTLLTTIGLFVVLVAALGGWALFNKARKERIEAIDRLLKDTRELVDRDAYQGYVEAARKAAEILSHDPDSLAGHAFLAYVDAIRWAEHGDGDGARDEAMKHVDAARKLGRHSHLLAAEAYLRAYGGDARGAKEGLDEVLAGQDGSQSPFLLAVLGAVQLRAGELDAARDALARSQKANPGDARTAWLLARAVPPARRGVRAAGHQLLRLRAAHPEGPRALDPGQGAGAARPRAGAGGRVAPRRRCWRPRWAPRARSSRSPTRSAGACSPRPARRARRRPRSGRRPSSTRPARRSPG